MGQMTTSQLRSLVDASFLKQIEEYSSYFNPASVLDEEEIMMNDEAHEKVSKYYINFM